MSLQALSHEQSLPESTLNQNIARQMIWRRNSPYFYQLLYTNEVEWPALSVQWWVAEEALAGKGRMNKSDDDTTCFIAMGTQTSGEQKNYLQLAKVYIPNQDYIRKANKDKPFKPSESVRKNDNAMEEKLKIEYEIEHQGEVNKIRHHPKKTNLIATRTPLGEIHVFDKSKCKYGKNKISPTFILSGHETEGYAIEWNQNNDAYLIGGSYDGKLSLWDANNKEDTGSKKILPLCDFQFHEKEIEDVSWLPFHESIFSSCDDEGWLVIWDSRNSKSGPIYKLKGHEGAAYSMQFSPLGQYMFASGGQDKAVKVWDIRNLSQNLFRCESPNLDTITQLKWVPDDKSAIWSVSNNLITLWNVAEEKAKFVHAGHMKSIFQMDIHPFETETIVSSDENNEVHVFQPNRNCKL